MLAIRLVSRSVNHSVTLNFCWSVVQLVNGSVDRSSVFMTSVAFIVN
jgi:hypothetical protein